MYVNLVSKKYFKYYCECMDIFKCIKFFLYLFDLIFIRKLNNDYFYLIIINSNKLRNYYIYSMIQLKHEKSYY